MSEVSNVYIVYVPDNWKNGAVYILYIVYIVSN